MKIARWVVTHPAEPTTCYTLRYTLRAGAKGRGQRLSPRIECWPRSHKSMALCDELCAAYEEKARALGYTIIAEKEKNA